MANDGGTREQLHKGARKVFAEQGFRNATVRGICAQAEAHVPAVSWRFSGKEKLYITSLQDYRECEDRRHPRDGGVTPESPARERLRASVRSMPLQPQCGLDADDERPDRLINQEFREPAQHFGEVFDKSCKPSRKFLADTLRELLPEADELTLLRRLSGVVGQCVLFDFARETISRMRPELSLQADNVERMADFIMDFSLGGLGHTCSGFQA